MGNDPTKWLSRQQFKKLKIGDRVRIRYIIGDCEITGEPVTKEQLDNNGDKVKIDLIPAQFKSGPMSNNKFNGKTTLVRQQIQRKL